MATTFDDLLTQLGTGKWNIFYMCAVVWWTFLLPSQAISVIFLSPNLEFSCRPPEEESPTNTSDCTYFVNDTVTGAVEERPCVEWDFDNSTFSRTLTSQFNLVCERRHLRASYHSVFMFGNVFGPFLSGVVSDRYGRKVVVIVGAVLMGLSSLLLAFLSDMTAILAVRFFMGLVNLQTGYTLALEVCEPRIRAYVGILLAVPWAIGTMAFSGVAYLIRDWQWLQLATSLPFCVFLPALWFLDESPRWLIVRGHHDRALRVLKKAARWNNAQLPPKEQLLAVMEDIRREHTLAIGGDSTDETGRQTEEDKEGKARCSLPHVTCGLCSTKYIRRVTVVMPFGFFVMALVFYGLYFSGSQFGNNLFVFVALNGLAEVPAYIVPAFLVAKIGRRITLVLYNVFCGIALLVLIVIPLEMTKLIMALVILGRLCISSGGQVFFLYTSELFPTEYRLQGFGVAVLALRVGSVLAPYIVQVLGPLYSSVLMGALSLAVALSTLALPDTLGARLPDTVYDLEDLFKRKKKAMREEAAVEMEPLHS